MSLLDSTGPAGPPPGPAKYRSPQTEADRFVMLAAELPFWCTIEELVAYCDDCGFWSRECELTPYQKRQVVRRFVQQLHDHRLHPLFGHVWEGEGSQREDYYRLERTFAREDYQTMVSFHRELPGPLHRRRAQAYALRGRLGRGGEREIESPS